MTLEKRYSFSITLLEDENIKVTEITRFFDGEVADPILNRKHIYMIYKDSKYTLDQQISGCQLSGNPNNREWTTSEVQQVKETAEFFWN
jgi:hypothetical protein